MLLTLIKKFLKSGALIIALFSVLSRIMGVIRDRVLATNFGASGTLDAYYAAFRLPDFIFTLLILGALSAALIPQYIEVREQNSRAVALALAQRVLYLVIGGLIILVVLSIISVPKLMWLIAPGFTGERLELTITLTRIMLWSTLAFAISNTMGSVLQAERKFFAFALAPLLYNTGIILGVYILMPLVGIKGLAWGVVVGSVLHMLVQAVPAYRLGFRLYSRVQVATGSLLKFFLRMGGRTIGLAATALEQLIVGGFLSTLAVGSVTAFAFASNLQSFPTNVFGVSLAIAAFPIFSELFSQKNQQAFLIHFSDNIRRILFFILPLSILFLLLRAHIVRIVLGAGEFDWVSTIRTAEFLGYLSIAMVADSVLPLLVRVFYALGDTKTPAFISLGAVILNTMFMYLLLSWGLTGIGIAYVLARTVHVSVLTYILIGRVPGFAVKTLLKSIKPIVIASFIAGAAAYGTLHLVAPLIDFHSFGGVLWHGLSAGLGGVVTYLVLIRYWQIPEYNIVSSVGQTLVSFFKK